MHSAGGYFVLTVVLALAGCGDDGDDGPDESTDASISASNDGSSNIQPSDAAAGDARTTPSDAGGMNGEGPDGSLTSPARDTGVDAQPPDAARVDASVPSDAGRVNDSGSSVDPVTMRKPMFVGVGYSGLRIVSRDLGVTWVDMKTSGGGGDDMNLLRSVTVGNGLIVAAGWKIWTSRDGAQWTERTNTVGQWIGGVRFGNDVFVAAGGYGTATYSSDGITWKPGTSRSGNDPARTVAFGNGLFVAATDGYKWWQTTDGPTWTQQAGSHKSSNVMWCGDKFSDPVDCTLTESRNNGRTVLGEGVYVSTTGGRIERSTDGKVWTPVYTGSVESVAFGYVGE